MTRPAFLIALLSLGTMPGAAAAELAPFTPERMWQLQRIGAPDVSPDGRFAVAAVSRFDMAENKAYANIWQWDTATGASRQLTSRNVSDGSPLVSPDGRRVAFVSQREGDTAPQLYLLPLDGGEPQRLTSVATGVAQPKWFPDGTRIAFLSRVWADLDNSAKQAERLKERTDAKMQAQVWDGSPVRAWDTWVDDRELHVFAVGVAGGEPEALTQGSGLQLPRNAVPLEAPLYDIAPDGRELAFTADSDPKPNNTNLDVHVLAIGTRSPRNLTADNPATDAVPNYSPDGRWLGFVRQTVKGFYGDTRRLMLVDRRGGDALRAITADWDRSADGLVWAPDSKRLYGAIDDAGTTRVYEIPLAGKPRAVTGATSFGPLAISTGRKPVLVGLRQSFLDPATLVRIDPRNGAAAKLSTVNDELLAGTALGTYESVTYTGANGAPIQMWVNYPAGFDRSKKHPIFLLIHGGPHNGITDSVTYRWNAQVFGSWGYVTAWPNFHGSSGFGQAFADSINPQQDELPYADVIAAADWLGAQPWADKERMVAGGGSYGGYLTAIVLGRPHPFKALVAHAAVYNWFTQSAADYAFEPRRFGDFWQQPEVFQKGSPHFGAANFATPTLVIHGQKDFRVPFNHGIELYQTLVNKGVPTRLVYFPDENHWVLKPQNSLFWYAEVRRWLDAWIAPKAGGKAADGNVR